MKIMKVKAAVEISDEERVVEKAGYRLLKTSGGKGEVNLAVQINFEGGLTVFLGQRIRSSAAANDLRPKQGMVVEINDPYEDSVGADCIQVLFDGETLPRRMRFRDLCPSDMTRYLLEERKEFVAGV